MKKLFAALICGVLILFSGCAKNNEKIAPFDVHPPFYKIENAETGAVVYMLGSMHVGKPEAVYPREIYAALDECDTLAVEVDIQALEQDAAASAEAIAVLQCPPGTTVKDYMGEDYNSVIAKFKKKRLYNRAYEGYIPALWSSLWSSQAAEDCGYDGDFGTDLVMLFYAKSHGKRVEEIETAKEQYQRKAEVSSELQMLMLNDTLALSKDETKAQFDMLYNAWREGDINALKALAEEEETNLPEALRDEYESYYDAMYTARQRKMADYIEEKLQGGRKTFVVVGALHYAAPPSIIDNLNADEIEVQVISYN
ncbi:MAG: TraB/GumN family protein [Oscillospiraceae bacterium]|nr:TraB/GumN family protein [Oscillospiraceae bacterium]